MTAGKGDTRRPAAVSEAEFAERWRATFSKVVRDVEGIEHADDCWLGIGGSDCDCGAETRP